MTGVSSESSGVPWQGAMGLATAFFLIHLLLLMSTFKALEPPLKLTVENSKFISLDSAAAFMDDFLHNGTAVHSATNTVASQLNQLYHGLREEKKRLKSLQEDEEE
ncbi:hypothetical protein VKS41_000913 [Umbelopsis sp. WA50703]